MAEPEVISYELFGDTRQYMGVQTFAYAGDQIPIHAHGKFSHASLCVKGQCEVFYGDGSSVRLNPGDFVEFKVEERHGLKALMDRTVVVLLREPMRLRNGQ